MLGRAAAIWFAIMVAAILNGAARDMLLVPRLGDPIARAISCVTLAIVVVSVVWFTLSWIGPGSMGDAWAIGALWLCMTLIFEFGVGHYVFRTPWTTLLGDYNVLAGRLWILVLITTLTAPAFILRTQRKSGDILPRSTPQTQDTVRQ